MTPIEKLIQELENEKSRYKAHSVTAQQDAAVWNAKAGLAQDHIFMLKRLLDEDKAVEKREG